MLLRWLFNNKSLKNFLIARLLKLYNFNLNLHLSKHLCSIWMIYNRNFFIRFCWCWQNILAYTINKNHIR